MSRLFYHVMQDNLGNLLFGVTGTMRLAGSATLATIYGDEALTVILPNPMTNHPSFGSFKCFLGAGDYDFYMAKSGYTFETLTGVQGHGTMAQQNADAVAIGGGTARLSTLVIGNPYTLPPDTYQMLWYLKQTHHSMTFAPMDSDTGTAAAVRFWNSAGTTVGAITTTASATTYGTASDARLKEAVAPLAEALATVLALRPVQFSWKADGSPGVGFVAQEVQPVVSEAVTGTPDAVDAAGNLVPMGIDLSKLVPYLVGALQALAQRLTALEGT